MDLIEVEPLTAEMITDIAASLRDAQRDRRPIAAPTERWPQMTIADAYAVQRVNLDRRLASRGMNGSPPRHVGWKIGITSRVVQEWLGVSEPDFGGLLCDMDVPNGGDISISRFLQPRVEGEVAFVLGKSLVGPGVTSAQVIAAIDFVLPTIEIIDSRVIDWKFRIQDTIADNASSAMFVLGSRPTPLRKLDLRLAGATLRRNGRVASTGAGAACLGNPVNAVVWLANKLGELGEQLYAGQLVLSGALGPVSPVAAGDRIAVAINGLGDATVNFTE